MTDLFLSVLGISMSVSALVLLLLLLSPFLHKRYAAKWKFLIWCILALRLLIPVGGVGGESAADMLRQWKSHILPAAESGEEMAEAVRTIPARVVVEVPSRMTTPLRAEAKRTITALDILAFVWAAGSVVYILINIMSYLYFRRRVMRNGTVIKDAALLQQLLRCKRELGIRPTVPVMKFSGASSPMLIGFLKPVLILPEESYSREELFFILKHELVHFRRKDTWMKLLLMLSCGVHWFNPVIWLMQKEAAVDMELACDERVVQGADFAERKAYTETLLATLHRGCSKSTILSTGFYGGKRIMKKRFRDILSKTGKKSGRYVFSCAVILTVSAGTLAGCSIVKDKTESAVLGEENAESPEDNTLGANGEDLSAGGQFAQLAGSWMIDFDRTDPALWGTGISYGDAMEISETGAFSYYIGVGLGGTGQCEENQGTITVEIDPYEENSSEREILTLQYVSDGETEYVLMDWHGEEVFWKRGTISDAGTAGEDSADARVPGETITLQIMKEGMPEEKQARLVVENGYILYLPEGEWQKYEADAWQATANESVRIQVARFEKGYPIERIMADDGYVPDDTGMEKEEQGVRHHVRLYEAETDEWCVFYSYPSEAEEGWGSELPVIADTFAVIRPGENITETGAVSTQILGYISAFDGSTVTIDRQDWVTPESPDWRPEYNADAGFEIVDLEGEDVTYSIRDDCTYHILENHQGESVELSREEFERYLRETEFPIFWSFDLENGEVKSFAEWYLP